MVLSSRKFGRRVRRICMYLTLCVLLINPLLKTSAQISYSQNFEAITIGTLPPGWATSDDFAVFPQTFFSCAGKSVITSVSSWMGSKNVTSPNFAAASSGADLSISFDYKYSLFGVGGPPDTAGTLTVSYLTDNGNSWTAISTVTNIPPSCQTVSLLLPGASLPAGANFMIRFEVLFEDPFGLDYNVAIDNLSLSQGSPLPIKAGKLTVFSRTGSNVLQWDTFDEQQGESIEVERSTDGKSFERLGIIECYGFPGSYEYVDEHPVDGANYYRLQFKELSGAYYFENSILHLMDINGKNVLSGKMAGNQVDISSVAPGVYLLKSDTGNPLYPLPSQL